MHIFVPYLKLILNLLTDGMSAGIFSFGWKLLLAHFSVSIVVLPLDALVEKNVIRT